MIKPSLMDIPLFEKWLRDKHRLSESTIYSYTKSIEKYFMVKNLNLENIEQYNEFLVEKTIKKRSHHYYSAIKEFINFKFNDDKSVRNNIIDSLVKPKQRFDYKQERIYLPEDKIIEVINNIEKQKHKVIALIQTFTGVRAGDIIRLKKGNIMSEEYKDKPVLKLVIIGKGERRNVVYIHDEVLQDLIMSYITMNDGFDEYYFVQKGTMRNREGNIHNSFAMQRMNYVWYWSDLKQALKTAGIAKELFATHDIRRCFARRAWEKYKDIHALQGLLNHRDPKTTLRYLEQSGLKNIDYHYEMQN